MTRTIVYQRILILFYLFLQPHEAKCREGQTPVVGAVEQQAETPDWFKYTRGFRRGHNFFLALGRAPSNWTVQGEKLYEGNTTELDLRVLAFFRYAYHLRLLGGFGYMLGSSIALSSSVPIDKESIRVKESIYLPGLSMGLIYDVSPRTRLGILVEQNVIRFPSVVVKQTDSENSFALQSEAYRIAILFDYFIAFNWSIHMEYSKERNFFTKKSESAELLNIGFNGDVSIVSLGLSFHLI